MVGGGLIRSLGGWTAAKALRGAKDRIKGDERSLGDGDFVQEVLESCRQQFERRCQYKARGYDFDWLVGQVASLLGLEQGNKAEGMTYINKSIPVPYAPTWNLSGSIL